MTFSHKRWQYNTKVSPLLPELQQNLDVHPVILQVLINLGIEEPEKIRSFFSPTQQDLSALTDIPHIKEAAQFMLDTIKANKKIAVYGDYDVDGITSTALYIKAFKELGATQVLPYLPHRFSEGYGLNKKALEHLRKENVEVVITTDCGISNYEEVNYAKELGLDVVVTDHHLPPVLLPKANHLVNPKLNNKSFPARELAGVGVAFKLVEQIFRLVGAAPHTNSLKYLDLVVLGTIADVVPLLNENRTLSIFGLRNIRQHPRTGIRALAESAGIDCRTMNVRDIGFALAPRLNAAGRMDHAKLSLELLLEDNPNKARHIAKQLNELNIKRQNLGTVALEDVTKHLQTLPDINDKKVFVFSSKKWHPGIIGIVAAQIVKQYNRPTILISEGEHEGRGSIRSFEGVNIFEPLSRCAYLLKDFGGHKEAAGFEIELSKIEEFKKAYAEIIQETIKPENLVPVLNIETPLSRSDINFALAEKILKLSPFGQGNPLPVFSTKELSIIDFRKIGDGSHLKITLSDGKNLIDGVAFGLSKLQDLLNHGKHFEIAFSLDINEWNGERKLQLNIKDIREI